MWLDDLKTTRLGSAIQSLGRKLPTALWHRSIDADTTLLKPSPRADGLSFEAALLLERIHRLYRRRFDLTLRQWIIHHQQKIVFDEVRWLGVRSLKNVLDSWIYQEIIHDVRPEIIVEIGNREGGSTLCLANLFDLLGGGSVIAVDIDHSRFRFEHPRITKITGDSGSAEVRAQVEKLAAGKKTLVIHDGDHSRAAVLRDLEWYGRLVSPESYLIVEDSIVDLFDADETVGLKTAGPLVAIAEFLSSHSEFEADLSRERYVLTYNPYGYLKRRR